LGGDWADDTYPDKPNRMRWVTYNRIMDKLVAANRIMDKLVAADRLEEERVFILAARLKLIDSD
jgi:hypothetical protein